MRPVRLELEGFTAFRERTVVDFTDAELFALTGPTGSGKTSLIDAMTFALYGVVPRLGEKLVAPLVAQGRAEARVRFDFTVADVPYTAVRVVRMTSKGRATTKEARLQRGTAAAAAQSTAEVLAGEVLAGDANGMTAAVEALLGLGYREFTTCVSLPQGDFARFLHATGAARQDLLVKLLDLGLYERIGVRARLQAERHGAEAAALERQLAALSNPTDADRAALVTRIDALAAAARSVAEVLPRMAQARSARADAHQAVADLDAHLALVAGVVVPTDIAGLAQAHASAQAALAGHAVAVAEAEAAQAVAESALAGLPPRAAVEADVARHDEAQRLARLVAKGTAARDDADRALTDASRRAADAAVERDRATEALGAARTANLAHALAQDLHAGDDCPVCGNTIGLLVTTGADLDAATAAADAAQAAWQRAEQARVDADKEQARVATKLEGVVAQHATATEALVDVASPVELQAMLKAIDVAAERAATAKADADRARRAQRQAHDAARAAEAATKTAWQRFEARRDALAPLAPPPADRVDLEADWTALADWAAVRHRELSARRDELRAHLEGAAGAEAAVVAELGRLVAEAGLHVPADPDDAVATVERARARAEADLERLDRDRALAATLASERDRLAAEAEVARALGLHLKADRFEKWLLAEVVDELVAGATVLLRELSQGAYSLATDDRGDFVVVDHVNADQARLTRTLSGGETFLASLALALALADQVAAQLGGAGPRLETILLDEGFGTLDPESLDAVATALEELGARGRTVGIVTHVRELADRLPVRFEVTKVSGVASVERVEGP